jgi:hypothetical protein
MDEIPTRACMTHPIRPAPPLPVHAQRSSERRDPR